MLQCSLGGPTRSTFLMVFSPDRSLMASTHGDHNIYVTAVKSGACVQTLKGHPRTPWCIAFHPSHEGVIASGCLGGQVRVWDLHCGSELWVTDGVIASLAFHPVERLLVIATFNELHFWDWSEPQPTCKVQTSNEKEKVRYVKFDKVGHQLVTGIANLSASQQSAAERAREGRGEEGEEAAGPGGDVPPRGRGRLEERESYSVIMDRYERLMERYHSLTNNRNRDLDWPERGASRAVDQPELVTAAVREGEGASRLLSDLAQVATDPRPGPPPSDLELGPSSSAGAPGDTTNPYRVPGPRYRRYSLLLDREDLDAMPRPRLSRGIRGREGARLRRVDTFREPGDDWAAYRRELRERMLELRRLRDSSREGTERRSAARDIQPASSILDLQDRVRSPSSPFHHSAESGFLPVTPSERRTEEEGVGEEADGGVLDIVGPPERSEGADERDTGIEVPRGRRIPVWTGGHDRRTFMEDFGEGTSNGSRTARNSIQEIDRVLRDSERVLRDSERVLSGEAERILDEPTTPGPFPDPLADVQRVTLSVEGRDNNNSPPAASEEPTGETEADSGDTGMSPTRTASPEDGLMARNYMAMGLGRRSVLLRRRQAQLSGFLSDRLAARRNEHRLRLGEARALGSMGGMSPPTSIPLLTPTQIVDRMDSSGPSRSPGRSPGRSVEPESVLPPLRPRIGTRGRRSTADAPSGSHSERMSMIQAELAAVAENPFTSRPPSSASEIEFELPATSSTVASPVHRPMTARGRYSVDIQPEDLTGRSSVGSEVGRSSVDSALRRSFSSDHNPDIGLGVTGDAAEEDFNSDSSNSRPSSRVEGLGEGVRRLYERSQPRSRRSGMGRRTSLLRLQEEVDMPVIPLERATSASSAVPPASLLGPGRSPRGGDTDRDGEDSGETTDVPLDAFENELGTVRSYELAPDSVPTAPGDLEEGAGVGGELEVVAEELPTEAPLLDINENRGEEAEQGGSQQRVFTEEEIVRRLDEAELQRTQAEAAGREEDQPDSSSRRRQNLDIALLSRHIDHMQRICRASLTDLTLSRQRRQIIRLQGIRRMLEDLQRQIRTLQASSELAGGGEEAPAEVEVGPTSSSSTQPEASQRFPLYPGRHRVPGLPRLRRTTSSSGSLRQQTMLASRSRLSRAHLQLVSQLRATFRAMEMSPDLSRRDTGELLASASQSVLEHTDATSTRPLPASLQSPGTSSPSLVIPSSASTTPRDVVSVARNDLRAMSQRLERLLRERREATERRPRAEDPERELERRTLDILDRRLGRGVGRGAGGDLALPAALTDSSPSDSEEERGEEGLLRGRRAAREGGRGRDMLDFFDQDSFLRSRRSTRGMGDTWRPLSMRERLDIRAGLRRETERERVRLSRERDLSLRYDTLPSAMSHRLFFRRVRYRSDRLAQGQGDRSDRLPPLRELIWRRLRRRTGQQGEEGEEESPGLLGVRERVRALEREAREASPGNRGETRERSRHREFLSSVSWAVDQLTIDPEGEVTGDIPDAAAPVAGPPPAPAPGPREQGGAAR